MFLSASDTKPNLKATVENAEECYNVSQSPAYSNLLFEQKLALNDLDRLECISGIDESENARNCDFLLNFNELKHENINPTIIINEDETIENIEMAMIESCFQRILTPEGNVKYKNYRILAPASGPIRVYSPSGDIHTTPKKGKVVPKFESFQDSILPREKLLSLINHQFIGSEELEQIIRPTGFSRKAMEIIRQTNQSTVEERMFFLSSALCTPCPSSFSMYSEDTEYAEIYDVSTVVTSEPITRLLQRASSTDSEKVMQPIRLLSRQKSVPINGEVIMSHMSLSDELNNADNSVFPRSHTPRTMTDFEYSYFHRPVSSLSTRKIVKEKPNESKKSILKNFVQQNMIDNNANQDKLAKLALAIEEDSEDDEADGIAFIRSAKQMIEKLTEMIEETKELRDELMEIQENFQEDNKRVSSLLVEARKLTTEVQTLNYLDDIIALLNGDIQFVATRKCWPFAANLSGQKKDPSMNLIV